MRGFFHFGIHKSMILSHFSHCMTFLRFCHCLHASIWYLRWHPCDLPPRLQLLYYVIESCISPFFEKWSALRKQVSMRLEILVKQPDAMRQGISATDAARALGLAPALAKEHLLAAEMRGKFQKYNEDCCRVCLWISCLWHLSFYLLHIILFLFMSNCGCGQYIPHLVSTSW